MSDIPTDEVARRLQHSARAVREWMAQDCPPDETPKLAIALLAEFARSVADDHLKRHNEKGNRPARPKAVAGPVDPPVGPLCPERTTMSMLDQAAGNRIAASIGASNDAARGPFDLVQHLRRQMEFSARTYGPGDRTDGVCDHIRKELNEVQADAAAGVPTLPEWVDVIILGFDGAWRSGATPEQIVAAIVAKQTKNEGRKWPDWRTADRGKAIEHDRSADVA